MNLRPASLWFACALTFASATALAQAPVKKGAPAPTPPSATTPATGTEVNLSVPDAPPSARTISLTDAFTIATREATDLRIAEYQVDRAEAARRIAMAALLPNVNGNLSLTLYDQEITRDGLVIRQLYSYGGGLSVSENISLRGINGISSADSSIEVSEADLRNARRLVLAAVAKAYFAELASQKNATLARTQYAAAERQHKAVTARVAAGVALSIDANRSELALIDAARAVADADASLARTQDLLGDALGLAEPVSAMEAPAPEPKDSLETYVDRALHQRPDLHSAVKQAEVASIAVDDAWFRFVPSLGVTWNLSWTPQTTAFQPNAAQWIGVATLSIPFYDGGVRYGAIRDAKASLAQSEQRIKALRMDVRNDVRDAYRRVSVAARAYELAQRSVEVARTASTRAEAAYNSGALTGLELDDTRQAFDEAELDLLLRALDRQVAVIDLLTFVGDLKLPKSTAASSK